MDLGQCGEGAVGSSLEVTMLVISLPVLRDTVSTLNPTDGFSLQFSGGFESSVK